MRWSSVRECQQHTRVEPWASNATRQLTQGSMQASSVVGDRKLAIAQLPSPAAQALTVPTNLANLATNFAGWKSGAMGIEIQIALFVCLELVSR